MIPYVINKGEHQEFFGVESKLLGGKIEFVAMSIGGMGGGKSAIQIQLKKVGGEMSPIQHKEVLVVEASVKPFINLVWVGTVLVLLGFVIAILRRKLADSI